MQTQPPLRMTENEVLELAKWNKDRLRREKRYNGFPQRIDRCNREDIYDGYEVYRALGAMRRQHWRSAEEDLLAKMDDVMEMAGI